MLLRHRHLVLLWSLGAAVALSRFLARARVADGFDSIDFLLGMARNYDLAQLQPHFPGYPVYVALGAGLCHLGLPALSAATAISSVAAGVGGVGLAVCAERLAGPAAGVPTLLFHLVAWQPWLVGSGALSDSLGVALAIAASWLLCTQTPRPTASGFVAGLLLGTRASYWPIVASLFAIIVAQREWGRARHLAFAGLALGVALWAVPFFAVVGIRNFAELARTHVAGHFPWWGGSVLTDSSLVSRAGALARDVFFDGFAPSAWALAGIGAVLALIMVPWSGLRWFAARIRGNGGQRPTANGQWPTAGRSLLQPVLVVLVPYAIWIFLAQNVVEQPRHALPLVEGGVLLLGAFLSARWIAVALVSVLTACASVPLVFERVRVPPAPAQAADWVAKNEKAADTAVFADRSWRYFLDPSIAPGTGAVLVRRHAWLSEAMLDLSRVDRLPPVILLTSEIDVHSGMGEHSPLPRNWRVEPGPRFCRDPRIDRAQPCLGLVRLAWSP
jgi:hypothetical protein